jgi:integrase/recombinase XerD
MLNLSELVNNYLIYCEYQKNLDHKTLKAYRIDLKQYSDYINIHTFIIDSKAGINSYINSMHNQYKPKSIKRKIASIKAFYSYLEFEEIIEINPFNKVDIKLREPQFLPKTISIHTLQIFLTTMYQHKKLVTTEYQKIILFRDIAVIELLFATGIRISELCSLKPSDIDLETQNVLIYGKGSKERMIQIGSKDVINALKEYHEIFKYEIENCGFYFVNRLNQKLSEQSVRYMIKKYSDIAAINQHITPHMFRHSFATLLLEEDVDIRYIQKMLGHSSITTTQIYTHVSIAKQKDILTTKHPRNFMVMNEG